MNTRTGELACDVAFQSNTIPTPAVALILGYNGAARPTVETIARWARPVLLGFESDVIRSYAGGDAGDADAAFSCQSFDEVGYPRDCGSWVCAADASSTPAQYLPNITEYGRRYALRMAAGGRSGPILAYGNPAAVEALCAGVRAAGLTALRWKVGTWGVGEGGGPNMAPDQADAELVQSGNTPGPVPDTDLDWLYAPVSMFAAMGGPAAATPTPKKKGSSRMELVISPTRALTHLGGVLDAVIPNPTDRVPAPIDIPKAAQPIMAANPGMEITHVGEATYDRLLAKLQGDAPPTAPVDLSEVKATKAAFDAALAKLGA